MLNALPYRETVSTLKQGNHKQYVIVCPCKHQHASMHMMSKVDLNIVMGGRLVLADVLLKQQGNTKCTLWHGDASYI